LRFRAVADGLAPGEASGQGATSLIAPPPVEKRGGQGWIPIFLIVRPIHGWGLSFYGDRFTYHTSVRARTKLAWHRYSRKAVSKVRCGLRRENGWLTGRCRSRAWARSITAVHRARLTPGIDDAHIGRNEQAMGGP